MYFVIADAHCSELTGLGVVITLVKLLSSIDKAVRSYAVICLASMARAGMSRNSLYFSIATVCIL